MQKILLLTTALVSFTTATYADTVTIGFWQPGMNQVAGLLSVAGPVNSTSPIAFIGNNPRLGTGFGFAEIYAMVIPPGGNIYSGGLGGSNPTFEFAFANGFAPPQGGTIRLYATWQSFTIPGQTVTLPSLFATNEMPAGINGFTVAGQIFVSTAGGIFCDNFVHPCGTSYPGFQQTVHDSLQTTNFTLTGLLPGQPFSITEVFDFTQDRGSFPFSPQGDVGAYIETTPIGIANPVPGPIVGQGLPGLFALGTLFWARFRRKGRKI